MLDCSANSEYSVSPKQFSNGDGDDDKPQAFTIQLNAKVFV